MARENHENHWSWGIIQAQNALKACIVENCSPFPAYFDQEGYSTNFWKVVIENMKPRIRYHTSMNRKENRK